MSDYVKFIIAFSVFFPVLFTLLLYSAAKKFTWLSPIITTIVAGILILIDIIKGYPEKSFFDAVERYLCSDERILAALLYAPMVVISIITTIVCYIVGIANRHVQK